MSGHPNHRRRYLEALLISPLIPENTPPALLYRTAAIGAIQILSEAIEQNTTTEGTSTENPDAIAILTTAVLQAPAAEVRTRALAALTAAAQQGHPAATDAVFGLAIRHQNQAALTVLSEHDLQHPEAHWNVLKHFLLKNDQQFNAADPELAILTAQFLTAEEPLRQWLMRIGEETHPNWAEMAGIFDKLKHKEKMPDDIAVAAVYSRFSDSEMRLFTQTLLQVFPERAALLADLFLAIGDPVSLSACLSHRLTPADPENAALFFFLSEQWEDYEKSDWEYRRIKSAFNAAEEALKRRLIAVSRRSGHSGWLREVDATAQFRENQALLSFSQWGALIRLLTQNHNFLRLWEVLPVAPAWYAAQIHTVLKQNGFAPESETERAFFEHIGALCTAAPDQIPLPLARRFYSEKSKAIQLGLSPDGERLAVLFLNDCIQFWNLRDRRIPPTTLQDGSGGFRTFAFSPDGAYLAAISYDHSIQIFRIPAATMVKRIPPGRSPLAALFIRRDGKNLISLEKTGDGMLWGFPHGTAIRPFHTGREDLLRSLYDRWQERLLLLKRDGELSLFDPQKNLSVAAFPTDPPALVTGQCSPLGLLTAVSAENRLTCWNLISQRSVTPIVTPEIPGRVLSAWDILPGELTALATQSGHCGLIDLTSGRKLAEIPVSERPAAISTLQCDASNAALYTADLSGEIAAWDLTLFNWFCGAFRISEMPPLKQLDAFAAGNASPAVTGAVALLKALIEWRSRFDIEIEFEF